jgi:type I restriction enzyme R subunit
MSNTLNPTCVCSAIIFYPFLSCPSTKDARVGQEQARQYAENIQKNSGKDMPFVFYTNGNDIYFWATEKYPPRKVHGFPTKKDLERMLFLQNKEK